MRGTLNDQASDALREVITAVQALGVKGKVVIELTVDPWEGPNAGDVVVIGHKVIAKPPTKPLHRHPYYVGENASLEFEDPNRPKPGVRPVTTVDGTTGEVVTG